MKQGITQFTLFFSCLALFSSCSPGKSVTGPHGNEKIQIGVLDNLTYDAVRSYLSANSTQPLQDTIMIKYDYNRESCWDIMDQQNDNHVQGFVTRHHQRVQSFRLTRPRVSFFEFREPGNNLNKLKKWNTSIIIDSSKQLMNLLFQKRAICGNSIIILPGKNYVFLRSDSHSEVLDLTEDQLQKYLSLQKQQ